MRFEVRSYSHCVGEFNYHIQITPAYRKVVMKSKRVDMLVKAYITAKLNQLKVQIVTMKGGPNHLHIFVKNCKNNDGIVSAVIKKQTKHKPLLPFDLTSLQTEAYSCLGLTPKITLEFAQELYTNSYISYPRTSSQKLPESIGYKKILEKLRKIFPEETNFLLKKKKIKTH